MKVSVITYIAIVTLATFSNAQAPKNPDLPEFTYLLTEKPEPERQQLCSLNKGFCETNCGGPQKAPMNFCNPTTMGWGCGCSNKVPDLLGYEWPINREHCIGSGEACRKACEDPKIPNDNKPKCSNACFETFTQKCGTPQQPPAYYNVSDINEIPTYAPPENTKSPSGAPTNATNGTGNTGNTNSNDKKQQNSASTLNLGNTATALVIISSGMSLLSLL